MKYIRLTKGMRAKVDDEDYKNLKKFSWCATRTGKRFWYAVARVDGKVQYLHRVIMKPRKGMVVDHINQNSLDNRRSNMRIVTSAQNNSNSRPKRKNMPKGVWRATRCNRFIAGITFNKKSVYIGCFKTIEEAAAAYVKMAKKLRGEEFVRTQDGVEV